MKNVNNFKGKNNLLLFSALAIILISIIVLVFIPSIIGTSMTDTTAYIKAITEYIKAMTAFVMAVVKVVEAANVK